MCKNLLASLIISIIIFIIILILIIVVSYNWRVSANKNNFQGGSVSAQMTATGQELNSTLIDDPYSENSILLLKG
jgi:flagellar basal body-associated protein FliL